MSIESLIALNDKLISVISLVAMRTSSLNLSRYTRLALLFVMLTAQGIAVAHDVQDGHELELHSCSTCIIGHGMGAAVGTSYEPTPLQKIPCLVAERAVSATLVARTNSQFARAPPSLSWNT